MLIAATSPVIVDMLKVSTLPSVAESELTSAVRVLREVPVIILPPMRFSPARFTVLIAGYSDQASMELIEERALIGSSTEPL